MSQKPKINPGDRVRVSVDGETHSVIFDYGLRSGDLVGFSRGQMVKFRTENIIKIENRLGVRNVVRAF